jgi:hypothetical protein
LRFCAIATRDHLAHARVLARSLEQEGGGRLTVLLCDLEDEVVDGEPFDVLRPVDVGLSRTELHRMAAIYDASELANALKPWALTTMLDRGGGVACLLDADTEVFGSLDAVRVLGESNELVLTPHTTAPFPLDGRLPSERELLFAGVYNGGFVVVSERGKRFLSWWAARLRRECRAAPLDGLNRDQRWLDLAPAYFDHALLTDPGYNVAYWNLHERTITRGDDGYLVNGVPLRFFHFSGYSPTAPDVLSRYQGTPTRIHLRDLPVVREICDHYRDGLLRARYEEVADLPYRYGATATGSPMDRYARGAYRRALLASENEGIAIDLADPFDDREAPDFDAWMTDPVRTPGSPPLPRYLLELHAQRPDLRQAFPDLRHTPTRRAFAEWVGVHAATYEAHPDWVSSALES